MSDPSLTTRFAPSPTGLLHLGHAYSARFGWRRAREAGGRFLLRIEDIDATRCRDEFVTAMCEDLTWLGLTWDGPVRRQSAHMADYQAALARLAAMEVLYPCFCTRAEIAAEVARSGAAPHGPEGPLYPGTCRALPHKERAARLAAGAPHALRLDIEGAARRCGPLRFYDHGAGWVEAQPGLLGDVVLGRKEVPASYHLAVTIDDDLQGITLVTRGEDLFFATHIHRLLQALLQLSVPAYHHHRLLLGEDGKRLAKRDRALTLRAMREAGVTPAEILRRIDGG
jgi:glutamyl-Q tRNA(Asp) synthetase